MSDALKGLYAAKGLANRYFDKETPVELWRAQSGQDFKRDVFFLLPHPGYLKRDSSGNVIKTREPDVRVEVRNGKRFVLGCRCITGDYRGISLFDCKVTWLGYGWLNYRIPKGTSIPENLAVTRDRLDLRNKATHYTLAPKDDMLEELFIQSLKAVAQYAERV